MTTETLSYRKINQGVPKTAFAEYGNDYKMEFPKSILNPDVYDLNSVYRSLLGFHSSELNNIQKNIIVQIFDILNNIETQIDPDRIKPFEFLFSEDFEIVLFRSSDDGLVNLSIGDDGIISVSNVSAKDAEFDFLEFYNFGVDLEPVVYRFLSF